MSDAPSSLPDLQQLNSDALRALILFQHERITEQAEEISVQRERLASREAEVEHLKLLIAKLRRMQFGRKSEKLAWQIEQLELRLDELEASRAEQEPSPTVQPSVVETLRRKPARKPLPEHLPRQTRKISPKHAACPDCGGELKHLGEDVSEVLEYVPASFVVIRQVRASGRVVRLLAGPKRGASPSALE